jgi:hypothetical protein
MTATMSEIRVKRSIFSMSGCLPGNQQRDWMRQQYI